MRKRVLVVDDEPDIRELLVMLLRDDPRIEAVASTGQLDAAVPLAAEVDPHAVILDVMFGHRTSAEILPELRAVAPDARIVVFTSSRRAAAELGLLDRGADVIVQKVTVSFDDVIDIALTPPLRLVDESVDKPVDTPRIR